MANKKIYKLKLITEEKTLFRDYSRNRYPIVFINTVLFSVGNNNVIRKLAAYAGLVSLKMV